MITLRCGLVRTLATAVAAVAGRWLLTAPPAGQDTGFEALLLRTCSLALATCLAWAWLAVSTVVLDAVRRRPRERRGVPAGLRRLVLAGCGVALAAGVSPALATPGPVPIADTAPRVVVVPVAEQPHVVVHPGDSLWAIAARALPAHASDADVSRAWRRLYDRNRAVIGADPSLIRPGQRLELPR